MRQGSHQNATDQMMFLIKLFLLSGVSFPIKSNTFFIQSEITNAFLKNIPQLLIHSYNVTMHLGFPPREHFWVTIKHGRFVVICRSFMFADIDAVVMLNSSSTRTRASARARSFSPDMFFSDLTVTRLSANYRAKALIPIEGENIHKKGGLNCAFGNFFFHILKNCPQVQSLK